MASGTDGAAGREEQHGGGGYTIGDERSDTAQPPAGTPTPAGDVQPEHPTEAGEHREYRAAELAAAAGITSRTLRFYRERRLLPPPRREGRIAWYDEHHLARLRTITALLNRGHTLGGIADLLGAFETARDSRDAAELLGLQAALTTPFSEETAVRLTPEQLADYYQGEVTPENLAGAVDIGYVAVDGDEFVHTSRRLLDGSAELVRAGVPLSAVLAAGRELRQQTDGIAEVFANIFRTHLLPKLLDDAPGELDPQRINEKLERLQPVAKQIVEAELGLALDRRVSAELTEWFDSGTPGDDSTTET